MAAASAATLMLSRDCFIVMSASRSLRQDYVLATRCPCDRISAFSRPLPSARRLAALFLRETDLDDFAVRECERVDEAEVLARAIGMDVDLVRGANLEQPPIADAEPAQPVRPDRLDRPDRGRAVLPFTSK